MWPTTPTQLAGFIITVAGIIFGFLKWAKWYVDGEVEKSKSKDAVAIAKYNAETAKQNAEILTASQVADLMKATQEVKDDILQVKNENKDKNEQLSKAMDKLESNLSQFESVFQQFLVLRLNQFEQTLIK